MRRFFLSIVSVVLLALGALAFQACTRGPDVPEDSVRAMNLGIGYLERYDYLLAFQFFDALADRHPDWLAAHVNRGLAALNIQDEHLEIAERAFKRALELEPETPHALVPLGILYLHTERFDEALDVFTRAAAKDPREPYIHYYRGSVLMELARYEDARAALEESLRLQPSLASAHYRLRTVYLKTKKRDRIAASLEEFKRLEDAGAAIKPGIKYGEGGRYMLALRGTVPPGWTDPTPVAWKPPGTPKFGAPVVVSTRRAIARTAPDGRAIAPAVSFDDLTRNGELETILFGAAKSGGGSEVVVVARGDDGAFRELAVIAADATVGASGDLDGDRRPEIIAGEVDGLRLFRSSDGTTFSEMRSNLGAELKGTPLRVIPVDADSDWDLDIVVLRQRSVEGAVRSRIEILNNNRDGSFTDVASEEMSDLPFAARELVVSDLDGDIDQDLIVFDGDGVATVYSNERVWRYRAIDAATSGIPTLAGLRSVVTCNLDGDDDPDLVALTDTAVKLIANEGQLRFRELRTIEGARVAAAGDALGVLAPQLVFLSVDPAGATRPAELLASPEADLVAVDTLSVDVRAADDSSAALVAIAKSGPPEFVVYDRHVGVRAWPLDLTTRWLTIDLQGPTTPIPGKERANTAGRGATVEVRAGKRSAVVQLDSGGGGTVRLPPRLSIGLGGEDSADYVRVLWPDGILQGELRLTGDRRYEIPEVERKPSSCPILFALTKDGYEFAGDFLGVGGIGYFEEPGRYNRPDPTEFLLLPELAEVPGADGRAEYRLEILEPLEECTYLDEFKLTVVDHPGDVTVLPDEMFAIAGPPPPGFQVLGFRDQLTPLRAFDLRGRDVTASLRDVDRVYGNEVRLDERFSGLAREAHGVVLEFGDELDALVRSPGIVPYLFLYGYIEYGYSTSNFAASQANAAFEFPTFEVERDGTWRPLRENWGFPAGYPRYMSVDFAELLEPGDRRIRVRTNLEIYWDQAFLAGVDRAATFVEHDLAARVADLEFHGFIPERSPDGRRPKIYGHGELIPNMTFKVFPGAYTRFGDVRELLAESDDRFVIFGPGDGIRLRFPADDLPPLPDGWKRTFFAKTSGYCKDTDLYTAHPERVEPLPFRAMASYPYSGGEAYPSSPESRAYREKWNTRVVEGTFLDGYDGAGPRGRGTPTSPLLSPDSSTAR